MIEAFDCEKWVVSCHMKYFFRQDWETCPCLGKGFDGEQWPCSLFVFAGHRVEVCVFVCVWHGRRTGRVQVKPYRLSTREEAGSLPLGAVWYTQSFTLHRIIWWFYSVWWKALPLCYNAREKIVDFLQFICSVRFLIQNWPVFAAVRWCCFVPRL